MSCSYFYLGGLVPIRPKEECIAVDDSSAGGRSKVNPEFVEHHEALIRTMLSFLLCLSSPQGEVTQVFIVLEEVEEGQAREEEQAQQQKKMSGAFSLMGRKEGGTKRRHAFLRGGSTVGCEGR